MEYAFLGSTGLRVSRLALGTAVLGLTPPASESEGLVHLALDLGINLFDCANTYGNRRSFDRAGLTSADQRQHAEELLGRALKNHRDEVVLCTKVSEPVGDGVNDGSGWLPDGRWRGGGLSRFHIMREVERSLRRLATDHIDIYHFHHPDPDTAIEETLRAADDLVHQGKVRYVGLSNYGGWEMTKAVLTAERHGLARPVLNQVAYNMINRACEAEVVPAALDLGVALTCFSPLAGGALAGTDVMQRPYSGYKRWGVPFDFTPEQKVAAGELASFATSIDVAPMHLALNWLASRPAVAAAIVGPETGDELRQNVRALEVRLDDRQTQLLNEIGKSVPGMPF